jgi:hypothetical protein
VPGEVAAGVAGAAIGTAGAVATAPFHGDSYAYYNDNSYRYDTTYRGGPHQNYAPQQSYGSEKGGREAAFSCLPRAGRPFRRFWPFLGKSGI